jgi:hypothetical protein
MACNPGTASHMGEALRSPRASGADLGSGAARARLGELHWVIIMDGAMMIAPGIRGLVRWK